MTHRIGRYMLDGAGTASANGCYTPAGLWAFNNTATSSVMYRSNGKWYIGPAGEKAYYVTTCDSSVLPPSRSGWINSTAGGGSSDGGGTYGMTQTDLSADDSY